MSSHDYASLEDLLLATLDAVSRFRVSQRDTVSAALEAGPLLTKAKGRLQHGEWGRLAASCGAGTEDGVHVDEVGRHGPNRRGRD